jgi:type VI secretion system protein ImpA
MAGLAFGLNLLRAILVDYWDCVNPKLDPDDSNDPTFRIDIVKSLANATTFLRDAYNVTFVDPSRRYPQLSVRNILIASGKLVPLSAEATPTQIEVQEILRLPENTPSINAAAGALVSLKEIIAFVEGKLKLSLASDIRPFQTMLAVVIGLAKPDLQSDDNLTAKRSTDPLSNVEDEIESTKTTEIRSREDAVRMLEKICEFIERSEPTNPAPLFIRRGQQLMDKSFVEIIKDLAPDSLGQIKQITGLDEKKT